MSDNKDKTKPGSAEFDFSAFPENTLFHERRAVYDRRRYPKPAPEAAAPQAPAQARQRRAKKERRRRIDPTTFEKQYTLDELEFMNAMQRFKERSGKSFPTHGEVLKVAVGLGYRLAIDDDETSFEDATNAQTPPADASTVETAAESTTDPTGS